MPLLSFDVYSNYDEVIRLRQEVEKLETKLRTFKPGTAESTIRATELQLKSARLQLQNIAADAAKAGAALEMNIKNGCAKATNAIVDLQRTLQSPIQAIPQVLGLAGVGMFLQNVTRIRGQFQLMETSISTILGSAEKGKKMMADLQEYAKQSPLDFQGTVGAAQMMLGFGIDQKKVLPFMKALGDVSMGDAQRFRSLTLAFSQMSAAGKLMGQDLMQMVNAGFQPLDQLAKDTGKSIGQLKEEMSNGKISAEMVQQAFINATSEGGKFYNMSQNATSTITGQMSMLGDATDLMFNDIGKASEDAIISAIQGATFIVENWKEVGGVLLSAITTFGIFKASAMASEFAIKAAAEERSKAIVQGYEEEIAKMEEYKRAKEMEQFDADLQAAMKSGDISDEMGVKIQNLRNETQTRLDLAKTAKEQAEAEVEAARSGVSAAQERLAAADELLQIAEESGNADDIAYANSEKLTAQNELNAAAIKAIDAETKLKTASTQVDTATEQMNTVSQIQNNNAKNSGTVAQNVNTVATQRNTVMTALATAKNKVFTIGQYIMNGAISAGTKALNAMKAAWATNPIGLIISALSMAIGLFMTFKSTASETTEEVKKFGEEALKTKRDVDTLYSVLESTDKDSKTYQSAIDDLIKKMREYGIAVDSEGDKLQQLIDKRQQLIALFEQEGRQRQIANNIATINEQKTQAGTDFKNELADIFAGDFDLNQNSALFQSILADAVEANKDYINANWLELWSTYKDGLQDPEFEKRVLAPFRSMAEKMGVTLEDSFGKDVITGITVYADKLSIAENALKAYTEQVSELNEEMSRTKPPKEAIDYTKMDMKKLTEEIVKTNKEIKNLNDNPVKPKTDTLNIDELIAKAEQAKDGVSNIDNSSATPYIDTKYLDIALEKLNNIQFVIKGLNGDALPLNMTKEEAETIKRLNEEYGGQIKKGQPLQHDDGILYNQIIANAKKRSQMTIDGKQYKLNRSQSAILQQLYDTAGSDNLSSLTGDNKKLYDSLINSILVDSYNNNKSDKESALKSMKSGLEAQIKAAKTTEAFDTIRTNINAQLKKVEQGSELYKFLQAKLKELDARDKSKQKDKDTKQIEYDLAEMERKEQETLDAYERKEAQRKEDLRIQGIEDGYEREIATIKNNAKKKRDALEDETEKEIKRIKDLERSQWMKQDPNRKIYNWKQTKTDEEYREQARANIGADTQDKAINTEESKSIKKKQDEAASAMREYLRQYGTYQQKKLAIAEEYAEKIRKAENEGEKMTLGKKRDEELTNLEIDALQQRINWGAVFGDFGTVLKDQLQPTLDALKSITNRPEFKKLTFEEQQKVWESITKLENQNTGWNGNIFNEVATDLTEFQTAMNDLTDAQNKEKEIQEKINSLKETLKTTFNPTEYARLSVEIANLEGEASKAAENVTQASGRVAKSQTSLNSTIENTKRQLGDFSSALQNLSSGSLQGVWTGFQKLFDQDGKITNEIAGAITKLFGNDSKAMKALSKALGETGLAGEIVSAAFSILDMLKDGVGNFLSQIIDTVLNAINGILSSALSFEIPEKVGTSLLKGYSGIINMVTFGGFNSALEGLGLSGESDASLADDIERLSMSNDALRQSIDNLADEMGDGAVADASGIYETQKRNIEEMTRNTQEMMARSAAAYSNGFMGIGGSHSSNYAINNAMSRDEWLRISNIVGHTVNSAEDFWNLTSEQMAKVAKDEAVIYSKIKQYADDGHADAAQYMDDYIQYYKELEELQNAYHEKLTDVSFDSIRDEFKSTLLDMTSDTEAFADSFENMMQQAVINSLMSSKYNQMIQEWYDEFAAAMENDATISQSEQRKLKQQWDNIVSTATEERDRLKEAMGWDGSETQQSSTRSLSGMTQDTAEAIEGRMTAIQIAVESIRNSESAHTASLAELSDELLSVMREYSRFSVHYDNIEQQIAKCYVELQGINENTGAIVKPIKSMQSDIAEIKKYTKNI